MSKLKRFENFEDLKADKVTTTTQSSKEKEDALRNLFVKLRKYKVPKENSANNNSKPHGG